MSDTGVVGGGKNDSIGTTEGALTGADVGGPGTFLIAVVGGIGGMCGKAVSYTHLTLPTSDLV